MVSREGEPPREAPSNGGLVTARELEEALVRRTFWFLAGCSALILIPIKLAWLLQGGLVVGTLGFFELATVLWCSWRVWHSSTGASRYLGIGLAIMYVQVAAIAWMQGGLMAPSLRWLAVLPIIAIVAGNLRLGLAFCTAFVIQVLVMAFYTPAYVATLRPLVLPNPKVQMLVSTVASVVLFSAFGWIAVRWRAQVHQVLEAAHLQAQRGNAAKQRFLATMSHEIRTPLNGIVGTASLLGRKNMAPQEQQQMLHLLDHSAQMLRSLLNDVLDWAKLEAGQMELGQEPVHLRQLLGDSADLFAFTAFEKGLELTFSHDAGLPEQLVGDGMRLRQALNNLVSNAVKFTRQGGVHVHLGTEAPASLQDLRTWVRIEVQDTGIGMTTGQVSNLFQPFTQGDQSTTRQYGGTGLGLSISRELLRGMGGDIVVSSRIGVGSCFVVRVPMGEPAAADDEALPTRAGAHTALAGLRLALLTDSPNLRRQVGSLAADLGLVLLPDGAQAHEADALLVDASAKSSAPEMTWLHGGAEGQRRALLLSAVDGALPPGLPAGVHQLYKPLRAEALAGWLDGSRSGDAPSPSSNGKKASEAPVPRPAGSGLQVLVAEDSEVNRTLLSEMLSHCQASSQLVDTGRGAVEAVKARPFDLLLMDYQMPEMDGLTATRLIRRHEAEEGLHPLPIVLISGEVSADSHAIWRDAGVNHILCKPFAFDELVRLVETTRLSTQRLVASAEVQ